MTLLRTTAILVCLAAFSPTASVAADQAPDRLVPMDIFNLELAGDPQISPDGSRVVYVRQYADIKTDQRYSNLWVINFDGSDHRPLTAGHYHDASPRWSPQGDRLLFVSDREGSPQIYVRWMDTGQTAKLTNLLHAPEGLAWSPDGRMISFFSLVPAEPRTIAKMPKAPEGAAWAEPAKVIDRLLYRYDRRGYLKLGYSQLFVMSAEPGTPRQLSTGDFHHGTHGFQRALAVWSPDSKHVLVSANRRESHDYEPLDSEVYEFAIIDGTVRALTDRQGPDYQPSISPDGKLIAYCGFDDRFQGYQVTRLYVMNRNGTEPRILSGKLDRSVGNPKWAPDGSGIYFLFTDRGVSKLGFYTLDGQMQTLAGHLGGRASAYGGATYSIGRDGRFAMNYTTPKIPGDIAVGDRSREGIRRITAVNRDLLAHKKIGTVEEVRYPSVQDGREIQGWIVKPPDFDPTHKYPLILEIHGGPFAAYGPRFDLEMQLYAAKDYVVLYTNPRGSTSYGAEFGNLIHHAYPGDDYFDLNAGIDVMVKTGYVDPDHLYVTGGSGGGVLTCWMIGKTDRFRAAVSAYPVINWTSFVLTADMSAFFTKYWFPGMPWDHPDHYHQRSLLSVVGNVKTPTMVITGEDDFRTPISESEQYYQALKLQKIDSVLVRVPGESHGIRKRPSHHMAKVLNTLGWFELHKNTIGEEAE